MGFIDRMSWAMVALFCLTLGLAPFVPLPHVLEKLGMLARGELVRPIDIFDLVLHGSPWLLAGIKGIRQIRGAKGEG